MINLSDCRIDVRRQPYNNDRYSRLSYVKITHIPTGITVTKINKSQTMAKVKCLEELEELLTKWITVTN